MEMRISHNCKEVMDLEFQGTNKAKAGNKTGQVCNLWNIEMKVSSLPAFENKPIFHRGRFYDP